VKKAAWGVALVLAFTLTGCGAGSKQDIVKKTAKVSTKAELERMLGKPDNFNKLGPVETWTYKASDGEVTFLITGDTVQMQAATGEKKN